MTVERSGIALLGRRRGVALNVACDLESLWVQILAFVLVRRAKPNNLTHEPAGVEHRARRSRLAA
ncbi:hypothetical protein [Mycobacteroides abscessus]|uniref:hypothetical protein n=1 Tax=Mycobacteroides abscessus TaxID=36809 RepID=UPI0011C430BC|nr:hypothetical protein [Mycobacteroides abscessus]